MTNELTNVRERVNTLVVHKSVVKSNLQKEKDRLDRTKDQLRDLREALEIAQTVAQAMQQTAHAKIARAVSRCLEAIFDDPYELKIRFDRKRNKTEAKLLLCRDGVEYNDPLNEVGGGVIDVASLALRLSVVMLSHPKRRRLLVLDEPFRNVRGAENKKRLRAMLLSLAQDLNFQFILNIDGEAYPEFQLGEVIQL